MKTIELHILAEDIKTTDYYKGSDCAITRALKRAGLTKAKETGGDIEIKSPVLDIDYNTSLHLIKTPRDLSNKVREMYRYLDKLSSDGSKTEPEDFKYSLEIPDHW